MNAETVKKNTAPVNRDVRIDDVPGEDGSRLITITSPEGVFEFRGSLAATIRAGLDKFAPDPRSYATFVRGICATAQLEAATNRNITFKPQGESA